jgi:hypothetical protein
MKTKIETRTGHRADAGKTGRLAMTTSNQTPLGNPSQMRLAVFLDGTAFWLPLGVLKG